MIHLCCSWSSMNSLCISFFTATSSGISLSLLILTYNALTIILLKGLFWTFTHNLLNANRCSVLSKYNRDLFWKDCFPSLSRKHSPSSGVRTYLRFSNFKPSGTSQYEWFSFMPERFVIPFLLYFGNLAFNVYNTPSRSSPIRSAWLTKTLRQFIMSSLAALWVFFE